ncbi:type II toxin-antitoxin system Phd/YefM family antitoxin [bacterium]|nr:type II toxin-antitoxin system Phd/YefM family antitoxin [bacterium]
MKEIKRMNSAPAKAMFAEITEQVRQTKEPLIIQKHNKDCVALVPLELLAELRKETIRKPDKGDSEND